MKKILLLTLLLFTPVLASADQTDPFYSNSWFFGNAYLSASYHPPLPTQENYDHSLAYVLPNGESVETDECSLTSATTLHCVTGDNVAYDASAHSVTLTGSHPTTYIFYEKGYQPKESPLSGNWQSPTTFACETIRLVIPYATNNTTVFSKIDEYYNDGFSTGGVFYLNTDKYFGLYFGPYPDMDTAGYYLYDANDNRITDINKLDTVAKLRTHWESIPTQCTLLKN